MTDAEAISKHFLKSEEVNWDDTFRTNVTGQFFMSMACLPLLAKGNESVKDYSSQVVNISSISGQLKSASDGQFSYAASKAASTHLSRMLATTFKDLKIRVNVIAPGIFPRYVLLLSEYLLWRYLVSQDIAAKILLAVL